MRHRRYNILIHAADVLNKFQRGSLTTNGKHKKGQDKNPPLI